MSPSTRVDAFKERENSFMLLHHTWKNGKLLTVLLTVTFAQDFRMDARVVRQPVLGL